MNHGLVEFFAYQETLLIMAVFGVALLAMIWVAFRRWLQHKEKIDRLVAEQTIERVALHGTQMERVEERLKAVEQIVTVGGVQPEQIDAPATKPLPTRS